MEKEDLFKKTTKPYLKEISKMVHLLTREFTNVPMVTYMMVIGEINICMVKELKPCQMEISSMDYSTLANIMARAFYKR